MGVIHKLRKEIVEFIVQSKKDSPNLSCRALSDMVWKKFKIEVSKSSVNTILKNSQLSSKIGRRSAATPSKTFTLPDFRKKQLFNNMKQVGMVTEGATKQETSIIEKQENLLPSTDFSFNITEGKSKVCTKVIPVSVQDLNLEKTQIIHQTAVTNVSENLTDTSKTQVPLKNKITNYFNEEFLNEIERFRLEYGCRRSKIYSGIGCFFLLAAKWEMSGKKFWQNVLADQADILTEAAADKQLWQKVTGSEAPLELCNVYGKEDHGNTFSFEYKEQMLAAYYLEKEQINQSIKAFEVIVSHGETFYMDPNLETISRGYDSFDTYGLSYAMTNLSSNILTNKKTISLRSLPYSAEDMEAFIEFSEICECSDKRKIKEINVIESFQERLASFSVVPDIKRQYTIGCWRGHPYFSYLTRNVKNLKRNPFYNKMDDRVFTYADVDVKITGMDARIRAIIFWLGTEEQPVGVLLTNASDEARVILQDFLHDHPLIDTSLLLQSRKINSANPVNERPKQSLPISVTMKDGIIEDYVNVLHSFCREHYLPQKHLFTDVSSAAEMFYKLPGRITTLGNILHVEIIPPESIQNAADLAYLFSQINKRTLLTPLGNRIILSLMK